MRTRFGDLEQPGTEQPAGHIGGESDADVGERGQRDLGDGHPGTPPAVGSASVRFNDRAHEMPILTYPYRGKPTRIHVILTIMARNNRNYNNFLYVDNNAVSWTKRGEDGGAAAAVDGHATSTNAPTWIDSSRMKVRRIIYEDLTTFRTIDPIFYTAAAWAAVTLGSTLAVQVPGLATTVNYTAKKKLEEKQPSRTPARQLADA